MSRLDWFNEARYGMFIHWGAYSVGGRGEWIANRERIPRDEYIRLYVNKWKAEKYDPRAWAQLALDAGMKYVVLTTRHHDGFALWDSKVSDFTAAKMGPKRDLLLPFVEAFRAAGLRIGFYYSPSAWYHPDYPGAYYRDWPGKNDWRDDEARRRFIEYYRAQVRELLTGYGMVDILWWDGVAPDDLRLPEINDEARRLQPDILVNSRLGEPCDYYNCEQAIRPADDGKSWEACMTLNGSWGYHAGDDGWKSPAQVIEMLVMTAQGAGNLLLNIGPRADGTVPGRSAEILREVGSWLRRNGEFLPNSGRCPFSWTCSSFLTVKGNRVYVHFVQDPRGEFCLAEIHNKVLRAWILGNGRPVDFKQEKDRLFLLNLPDPLPEKPLTTIAIEVEGNPEPVVKQTTAFFVPG
jgi:alpha-L-fucosidase